MAANLMCIISNHDLNIDFNFLKGFVIFQLNEFSISALIFFNCIIFLRGFFSLSTTGGLFSPLYRLFLEYNLLTPLRNQGRFDVPAALIIYAYQLIPCFASN